MSHEVKDFDAEVIERSRVLPVVVDFWAEWCGPCKVLGPILERLEKKSEGRWELAKLDTDRNQEVAMRYGIRGIPSVKLFVDGNVVNEFTGAMPEPMVVQWLEKSLPSKIRKEVEQAQRLLLEGRDEEGRKLLERLHAEDPADEQVRVLLAGALVMADPARAVELVAPIEAYSEQYQMVEAIRSVAGLLQKSAHPEQLAESAAKGEYLAGAQALAQGDFAAAVRHFVAVIRTDRQYDDDGARKACIAIFRILGDEHPVTAQYRREFSSALYS